MNFRLATDTISGNYPLTYKLSVSFSLLQGMWTSMSSIALTMLIITSFLTGANVTLILQRLFFLRKLGNLHIMVGGSTLLGLVAGGCASCGLPVIALLGLSGSVAYLPFRGSELSYIAVLLLSVSFFVLLKSNMRENICDIPAKLPDKLGFLTLEKV